MVIVLLTLVISWTCEAPFAELSISKLSVKSTPWGKGTELFIRQCLPQLLVKLLTQGIIKS